MPPALAGRDMDSAAIRAAVPATVNPYALQVGPSKRGDHSWAQLMEDPFQVRGPHYMTDKVKVEAAPPIFDLMHVSLFRSNDKIGNVAARHDSWLRAARKAGDTRYYLVVVYVTPAAPFIHVAMYYAVQPSRVAALPHLARLWEKFTAHGPEADEFRNERWKVIPRIAEGSWVVSRAVGTKPALLAQKLSHSWILCDGVSDQEGAADGHAAPDGAGPHGGAGAASGGGQVAAVDAGCASAATLAIAQATRARGPSYTTDVGPGPYLEADCNVSSSSVAFVLVSLLQQYARYVACAKPLQ